MEGKPGARLDSTNTAFDSSIVPAVEPSSKQPKPSLDWRLLRRRIFASLRRQGFSVHDADDVAQQTLIELVRRPHLIRERGEDGILAYALIVARRAGARAVRRSRRSRRISDALATLPAAPAPVPEHTMAMNDLWRRRYASLEALPVDLATLLRKCGVQELPIEQAAFALQVPVGTAKTRLRKARALWRDTWRKHGL